MPSYRQALAGFSHCNLFKQTGSIQTHLTLTAPTTAQLPLLLNEILAHPTPGPIIDTGANGHFITVVDALRYSTTLALHLRLSSGASEQHYRHIECSGSVNRLTTFLQLRHRARYSGFRWIVDQCWKNLRRRRVAVFRRPHCELYSSSGDSRMSALVIPTQACGTYPLRLLQVKHGWSA
jgi:hypothetical protein